MDHFLEMFCWNKVVKFRMRLASLRNLRHWHPTRIAPMVDDYPGDSSTPPSPIWSTFCQSISKIRVLFIFRQGVTNCVFNCSTLASSCCAAFLIYVPNFSVDLPAKIGNQTGVYQRLTVHCDTVTLGLRSETDYT